MNFALTSKHIMIYCLVVKTAASFVRNAVPFHRASGRPLKGDPCRRLSTDVNTGTIVVSRNDAKGENLKHFNLSYRVFRPKSLSSLQGAPVVALHGGPSLPSDYLEPLVDAIPYRSIVLYDQLGCGESDEPNDVDMYSVEKSIDDLEILLKKLGVRRFHLYGHSYGGMLAYEYIKRIAERKGKGEISDDQEEGCLSVVLSSSGTSIPLVEAEWDRLEGELTGGASFRKTHQCRTQQLPEPLERAFQKMGKTWAGFDAIPDYELSPPSEKAARMPSALILRGEYDFSTELCNRDWDSLFNHKFLRKKVLEGCSHFALLENGSMYGEMLESFFSEYD